jgi:hypothetical protein
MATSPLSIIPAGLSSIVGLLGALFGGSTSTTGSSGTTGGTETNSSGSSNSTTDIQSLVNFLQSISGSTTGTTAGTGTATTSPNLNPASQALISQLTQSMSGLNAPSVQGLVQNQTANINANSNAQSQAVNNVMASRGLSTSPVAATAQVGVGQNRVNQINQVQAQAPIEQNQLELQDLATASGFANMLPNLSGSTTSQNTGQTTGTTSNQNTSSSTGTTSTSQMWQNLWNYLNSASGSNTTSTGTTSSGGLLSDKRLKKDIKPIESAIDKISKLQATTWKWKGGSGSKLESGFIAQDLEKILPHLVGSTDEFKVGTPLKTINYVGLIPYIINSIQELDARTA